jgi:hypothetical protein
MSHDPTRAPVIITRRGSRIIVVPPFRTWLWYEVVFNLGSRSLSRRVLLFVVKKR